MAIAAGLAHTCALLADHTIRCWGSDYDGALGDGTTGDANGNRPTPVAVVGINTATAITAGSTGTCALLADRTMRCWGADSYGQLGDGTTGDANGARFTPVAVKGITTATAVATFGSYDVDHTCALLANHTISCWGWGADGELGNGTTGGAGYRRLSPVKVSGIRNAIALAGGAAHSCALLSDHTVKCWGFDSNGQLGDGTTGDANGNRLTPVAVVGIENAVSVTAGLSDSCAMLADWSIQCWGLDGYGQLGDGTTGDANGNRLTPVRVVGA